MKLGSFKTTDKESSEIHGLAANLSTLLTAHNLNINQLSQALGIPMMTIRRLISGETSDPRVSTIKLIAEYFDVSIDSLLHVHNNQQPKPLNNSKPIFIPILDWDTAEKMDSIKDIDLSKWNDWQPISLEGKHDIGEHAFALESRPSMHPRFPQGTVLIIDPDISPTDGDIVLVKIKKDHELTLRDLVIDPPEWQLHSIVSDTNSFLYSKQSHLLVGVVLLTMLYTRRT